MLYVRQFFFLFHVVYGFMTLSRPSFRDSLFILDKHRCCFDERPFHFLSLNELVFYYGDREVWWGDLNTHHTRYLYHQLLPVYHPFYVSKVPPETLALMAYQTRKAVKRYVRHRSRFHVRWMSILTDLIRHLLQKKKWRPSGLTFSELWDKYEKQLRSTHPHLSSEELHRQTALLILQKSCHTNPWIDHMTLRK